MYSESQVFDLKTEQSYCFLGDSINPSSRLSPFKNDAWNITIFHNDNEEIFRDPLMTGNSWSAFVMPGCRNIFHNLPNVTSSKHKLAKNPLIWAPQSTCYTNHSSCCCTLGELDFFLFQGARFWGLVCLVRFLAIPTLSQSPAFAISARFCSPWLTDSVWCWAQHWWTMGERV